MRGFRFGFGRKKAEGLTAGQLAMAGRIAGWLLAYQRRLADGLNARFAGCSVRRWKTVLIVAWLLFGLYFGYLLVAGFGDI